MEQVEFWLEPYIRQSINRLQQQLAVSSGADVGAKTVLPEVRSENVSTEVCHSVSVSCKGISSDISS